MLIVLVKKKNSSVILRKKYLDCGLFIFIVGCAYNSASTDSDSRRKERQNNKQSSDDGDDDDDRDIIELKSLYICLNSNTCSIS